MTLSLEAIHQSLNDFFLKQFGTEAGSSVVFRFDRFGSVLGEQDFIDQNHAEWGYSPAKARETFSDLVNHIPVDINDGMNISLSQAPIDDTYFFQLLNPSIPYIPYSADEDTKQSIINTFNSIKADALKVWNNVAAESSTGLMMKYKPSLATPENWYDTSKNEVWTSQSFQITATSSVSSPSSSNHLWKLKVNDESMRQILQLPKINGTESQLNIANRVLELQANSSATFRQEMPMQHLMIKDAGFISPSTAKAQSHQFSNVSRLADNISITAANNLNTGVGMTTANNLALYNTFLQQCHVLNVNQRLIVNQYIDSNAPTQPVESSSVNISFDYCLVKVRRPWYVDVFINQKSWYIPAVPKGQVKFPLMPSGFVVIRNLKIGGDWTIADIKNASNATHFGPFQVTLNPETHQLVHPGLQIIGWILQRMPDLPPNQDPKIDAAYEEAAKVLSNKANQLLSNGLRAVIQQFPGVMPSGSDQRRFAVCLRDLNYYLKPVIDSCGAGSTNPIDNALAGIKETNQSLGFSVGWSVAFYQYIKANHGLSGDAAAVTNKYLDYAIGQLS